MGGYLGGWVVVGHEGFVSTASAANQGQTQARVAGDRPTRRRHTAVARKQCGSACGGGRPARPALTTPLAPHIPGAPSLPHFISPPPSPLIPLRAPSLTAVPPGLGHVLAPVAAHHRLQEGVPALVGLQGGGQGRGGGQQGGRAAGGAQAAAAARAAAGRVPCAAAGRAWRPPCSRTHRLHEGAGGQEVALVGALVSVAILLDAKEGLDDIAVAKVALLHDLPGCGRGGGAEAPAAVFPGARGAVAGGQGWRPP